MKYGIEEQLQPVIAEVAERFHVALVLRLYELQRGAAPDPASPVDAAIGMMARWNEARAGHQKSRLHGDATHTGG
jgi:hypothetical protein